MPDAPYLFSATSWELRRPALTSANTPRRCVPTLANSTWVGETASPQVQGASERVADCCSGMEGLCECGF
jgi:hypothetical protein